MGLHVIVGSGPVGSAVATELLSRGESVRMVTRRGTGLEGTERVAADAGQPDLMRELSQGAQAIYNCANPAYHRWTQDWPPIANALLAAAESSGAVLTITGNLYGYGPVDTPMTEATPLRPSSVKGRVRVQMWQDALAAQQAGRIRGATEVRGSDYVGAGPSILTMMVLPRIAAGKTALVPADLDAPHTWTNPADEGRMLVAAATQEKGWGRAWYVPSAPPVSVRELSERAAAIAGIEKVRLMALPTIAVTVGSLFDKMTKEFKEMNYQFRRPFVLDATETTATFGATATPLEESLRQNVASYLSTV
jgi:nucleoside-diphosphate-sugar epimerase